MKVFVFGASGMLGQYLTKYLSYYFEVVPITRNEIDLTKEISLITQKYTFDSSDLIINASGIIKQRDYSSEELIRVNSLFPHFLARLGCNVIHITTDCVFSGNTGYYDEDSPHDCLDDYGKSKSLGECKDLTIIRTSIIGEELYNKRSLLEVIRASKNSTINGFINHFWNGITCLELSKQIRNIIETNSYWKGVRHFHSPDTVSKFQLVSYINEIYKLGNTVNPMMVNYCNRSLSTKYDNPVKTNIRDQIIELREFGSNPFKAKESKLEGFPPVNFISIPESHERREKLINTLKKYNVKTVRPYIYERYKSGDHKIVFPDPNELPDYKFSFPDACLGAFTSHFKAIKDWYENTDEEYAIFCEDDISFETVEYWNFTWKEFFDNLPVDWECVQLSLVRAEPTIFIFYGDGIQLRHRCWCDWSACAYLINRDRARKMLDTYYDGETFVWDYRGSDKQVRKEQHYQTWPYEPGIETIIFSILDNKPVYTFPLLVFDNTAETTVWGEDGNQKNMFGYSYSAITNWWKTEGKNLSIKDLIKIKSCNDSKLTAKEKLKNFPSVNFINTFDLKDRREYLFNAFKECGLTNITPHIFKRYEEGDCKIVFPPNHQHNFPNSYFGAFTSHLKAIKKWYETTNEEYAFFCEDDISFETVEYWNFTWEEFFNSLPSNWNCVQLGLTRYTDTMFLYFDSGVKLRARCWCDWGAFAYLISRNHAKRLLDHYYDGDTFVFEYKGSDRQLRIDQDCPTANDPGIETILYSIFDDNPVHTFPLFVSNTSTFSSKVWPGDSDFYSYSREVIVDWWKTQGKDLTIRDFIK